MCDCVNKKNYLKLGKCDYLNMSLMKKSYEFQIDSQWIKHVNLYSNYFIDKRENTDSSMLGSEPLCLELVYTKYMVQIK